MSRDSALDQLAFAVGYRLMDPAERRNLRITVFRELGEAAPLNPSLAVLEDTDRLLRGERSPETLYDTLRLQRSAEEAVRDSFDERFWRNRRTDLEGAGFTPKEAVDVIASVRASLGDIPAIETEGHEYEHLEKAA